MTPLEAAAIEMCGTTNEHGCEWCSYNNTCTWKDALGVAIRAFMEALPSQDRLEYMKRWDGPHTPLLEDAFTMGRESLRREIEEALK